MRSIIHPPMLLAGALAQTGVFRLRHALVGFIRT
jgi:hypothetical protein